MCMGITLSEMSLHIRFFLSCAVISHPAVYAINVLVENEYGINVCKMSTIRC